MASHNTNDSHRSSAVPELTLSVVSHGQADLVAELFADIAQFVSTPVCVILTVNVPESEAPWASRSYPFEVEVLRNPARRGFGANHNAALTRAKSDFFCVLNPDLRISVDPFPALISVLTDPQIGVVAPSVAAVAADANVPEFGRTEIADVF